MFATIPILKSGALDTPEMRYFRTQDLAEMAVTGCCNKMQHEGVLVVDASRIIRRGIVPNTPLAVFTFDRLGVMRRSSSVS